MSAALAEWNVVDREWAFTPSIARDIGEQRGAAFWALSMRIAGTGGGARTATAVQSPSAASATLSTNMIALANAKSGENALGTQEMVAALRGKGMPISALADVLDVERKTVYSWLDDSVEASTPNYARLCVVYELLSGEADGSLRFFHRFWERTVPDGLSLKSALMAREIDTKAVRIALGSLRETATRSMRADADRKTRTKERPAASLLTIDLVAGRRD